MMMSAGLKAGGPSAPIAAAPDPEPAPAAPGPQEPEAPETQAAREERDPELADDADEDEDARRAELAQGLAGWDRCEHNRTHRCDRCGVQRVYSAPTRGPNGEAVRTLAWRGIPTGRAARGRLGRSDADLAVALGRLEGALSRLAATDRAAEE